MAKETTNAETKNGSRTNGSTDAKSAAESMARTPASEEEKGAVRPRTAQLRSAAAERGKALTSKVSQVSKVEDPKAVATATWTAVRARKALVTGVGAGVLAVGIGSFYVGRRAAVRHAGPLTRMTGGRL